MTRGFQGTVPLIDTIVWTAANRLSRELVSRRFTMEWSESSMCSHKRGAAVSAHSSNSGWAASSQVRKRNSLVH